MNEINIYNDIIDYDVLNDILNRDNTIDYNKSIKSISKSKYERHIHVGSSNIIVRHLKKLNRLEVTKRSNKAGRKTVLTPEQAIENQKESNRQWKRLTTALKNCDSLEDKQNIQNKIIPKNTFKPKASNKMLSYWLMNMYSMFEFDYFVTLNHTDKYILDRYEAKKTKTYDEYWYNVEQDKYSKQGNITLENLKQKVNDYLAYIKKENKIKLLYYIIRYEKNIKDNWHAHIALRLDNPSNINIHNYLNNRWFYSKIRKKTVKKIGNTKLKPKHQQIRNVLSYMFKKLDHYNNDITEYEVHGIDVNTPIKYVVKKDNRHNYDMRMFEQLTLIPLAV